LHLSINKTRAPHVSGMEDRPYQMCSRCVMDTSAPDIQFDVQGVCNYCSEFLEKCGPILHESPALKQAKLEALVTRIRANSEKGKLYDCVVGVSGGVDSSWVLLKAVELGLRPLPVHMDNGWNSELAQSNIANLVNLLGLDLYTHVIDWEEYRALMQAFFDADVVDIELLYDNAMQAVNFQQAAKFGLKCILSGSNKSSEGIRIPRSWAWHKYDLRNIKAIGRQFGRVKLSTFPGIGTFGRAWHEVIQKRHWIGFLDYLNYDKFKATDELCKKFNYKPYPYKHYESIFTRFYQGYILPKKFGIDKRRMHFSTLIMAGQMSRESALVDLTKIPYSSLEALNDDMQYFLKKMQWNMTDLERYIGRPRLEHDLYPSERKLYERLTSIYQRLL
jgi:N-acetyl sugar amidotransferase